MAPKNNIFRWFTRYISITGILLVGFMVYVIFIQENSIFRFIEYNRQIDSLQTQIAIHTDTMNYYHDLNHRLSTDPQTMERAGREYFFMNRDGEDVYKFE